MSYKEGTETYLARFPPGGLKAQAEAAAKADGRTLNNWLMNLITREVSRMAEYTEVDGGLQRVRFTTEYPSQWRIPPARRIDDRVYFPMTELYSDANRAVVVGMTGTVIGYDATVSAWPDRQFAYAVEVSWKTDDGRQIIKVLPADEYEVSDVIDLDWTHEKSPDWDGTGTVAESWYAEHGQFVCRIDHFTDEEGGGYAYTVTFGGSPVHAGENMPADSFEAAEAAMRYLMSMKRNPR